MKVKIKKLHPDAQVPKYATSGSSGFDFHAVEDVTIAPGETVLVKTGLAFNICDGFELQVRPRSGLSLKTPLRVSNAPGTVDADYRGEVCVIMTNTLPMTTTYMVTMITRKNAPQVISKGDRIAQGVICPVVQAEFEVVEELEDTSRGQNGFGSSGT